MECSYSEFEGVQPVAASKVVVCCVLYQTIDLVKVCGTTISASKNLMRMPGQD